MFAMSNRRRITEIEWQFQDRDSNRWTMSVSIPEGMDWNEMRWALVTNEPTRFHYAEDVGATP